MNDIEHPTDDVERSVSWDYEWSLRAVPDGFITSIRPYGFKGPDGASMCGVVLDVLAPVTLPDQFSRRVPLFENVGGVVLRWNTVAREKYFARFHYPVDIDLLPSRKLIARLAES